MAEGARYPSLALDRWTWALLAVGTLLLMLEGAAAYQAVLQYRESALMVTRTLELQDALDSVYTAVLELESSQRRLVITRDLSDADRCDQAGAVIDWQLARLQGVLQGEPDQVKRLEKLESAISVRTYLIRSIVEDCRRGRFEEAVAAMQSGRGLRQMDDVRKLIAAMKEAQSRLLEAQRENLRMEAQTSGRIILGGSALAVVVTLGYGMLLRRHLLRRRRAELERDRQFESSVDLLATMDLEGNFLHVNAAWGELLGHPAEKLLARPLLQWVHPEDGEAALRELERWRRGEETRGLETRFQRHDGSFRWFQWNCRPFPGEGVVYVVARDVTERRTAQARREVQYGMARLLSQSSTSLASLPRLMDDIAQGLDFDVASLWAVDELEGTLRVQSTWVRSVPGRGSEGAAVHGLEEFSREAGREFSLTQSTTFPGRVYQQRIPSWMADVQNDPSFTRGESVARAGLRGAVAFPVLVDGKVVAVLEFFRRDRLESDPDLMQLIMSLSAQISQSIERGRVRESLERLGRQMELILNSAGDGLCGLDTEGRVTFANPAASRLTGFSHVELLGAYLHDLIHRGSSHERADCPLVGAFRGEATVGRKNGSSFPSELTVTPIREHGRTLGTVVSFRDITERKEVERMKDEFVSVVSHELRTPLTSIRGSLGLLAGGVLGEVSPRAQRMLDIAVNNTDRLVRLINEILDIERMESGEVRLNLTRCGTRALAAQALDVVRPLADRGKVRLESSLDDLALNADSDRVVQALTNLLSNAIKFSEEGAAVSLTAVAMPDSPVMVEFSVQDHGRGIPANKLDSIFGRFQQVDASDSREKGGTGLGLAICKSIVTQHGGTIGVESQLGQGSRFWFRLPVIAAEARGGTAEESMGRSAG
ncbi:MAG: PAS domain S-box protein [Candidatus Eremiobacterota bacterium]